MSWSHPPSSLNSFFIRSVRVQNKIRFKGSMFFVKYVTGSSASSYVFVVETSTSAMVAV
jgi:hypothetical protein